MNQLEMKTTHKEQIIRQASQTETEQIMLEWADSEGWNPGLYDSESFYSADPHGFFIGFLDEKPVSCISVVKYNPGFAFLGFYMVRPEFRGCGYGYEIWKKAIAYAGSANIGLDGVVDQQENYKKSGFSLAYRNIRYKGKSEQNTFKSNHINPINQQNFPAILQYDAKIFPAVRQQFLKKWLFQPENHANTFVEHNQIKGYIVLRRCRSGYKTGPLFANSPEIAESLLHYALNQLATGTDFYIDVPEYNHEALNMVAKTGMQKVFETARMYTGRFPETESEKVYSVTSFELG